MKIICEGISKDFKTPNGVVRVLDGLNLETQDHDLVCILGPNGCGKSTLLKIIAGLIPPSQGRIIYEGQECTARPATLVFQEDGLFPWLNVRDNLCFGLEMRGSSRQKRYEMAGPLMHDMGLMRFSLCYPHQLSMGMKQKVSLIRGLLTDSPVILMDEPDKSLDIYAKLLMCEDIRRVWTQYQKTVVCVTHDIDMALKLFRTVLVFGRSPTSVVKKIDMRPILGMVGTQKGFELLQELKTEIEGLIRKEADRTA